MNYDPETYWEERYRCFRLSSSGHRDLPEAYNYWLYERKKSRIRQSLRRARISVASSNILEIGCGTGVYVDMWKKLGAASVTGFDITSASVENLTSQYPGYCFYKEDITDPTLTDRHTGSFDVVTAFDVLYHVVDETKFSRAIANIGRLCRPGGLLLIHDVFLNGAEENHGYICWRRLSTYMRELCRIGFEIRQRLPIFYFMIQAVDLRRGGLKSNVHERVWDLLRRFIDRTPDGAGRVLSALDALLLSGSTDGPSMELLVCQKTTNR
jgi:SAM-dependent methyltransferase